MSSTTAPKWWKRWKVEGEAGLEERSCPPRRSPNVVPRHRRRQIEGLLRKRESTPRIAIMATAVNFRFRCRRMGNTQSSLGFFKLPHTAAMLPCRPAQERRPQSPRPAASASRPSPDGEAQPYRLLQHTAKSFAEVLLSSCTLKAAGLLKRTTSLKVRVKLVGTNPHWQIPSEF